MPRHLSYLVPLLLFFATIEAQAQIPPNGSLEVAYRQLDGGKLSDSVHLLTSGVSTAAAASQRSA